MLLAAAVIHLIYTIIHDSIYSIIILLLSVLAMGFISGYFYPVNYLPDGFDFIGRFLPTRWIFSQIRTSFTGEYSVGVTAVTFAFAAALFAVSITIKTMGLRNERCS